MANRVCSGFMKLAVVFAFIVTVAGGCSSDGDGTPPSSGGSGGSSIGGTSTAAGGNTSASGGTTGSLGTIGAAGNGSAAQAWMSVASSSDGTKLVAVTYHGYIYTSVDSGRPGPGEAPCSAGRPWRRH